MSASTASHGAARMPRLFMVAAGLAAAALGAAGSTVAHASSTFAVGLPTVVDPVRAAGEPDIIVDNHNNALITGPAGSSTQTSYFWRSRDGGLTYPLLGPSGGHWVCAASGGGDSLVVPDRATDDLYLTDQESLADLGTAKLTDAGVFTSACASAPAVSADRPFEAVLNNGNSTAPQSNADLHKPIVYLSYLCDGCLGSGNTAGALAFGWSDDGVTFHPADPGVTGNNLATNNFMEGGSINNFQWHGPMVVDPSTGYVFTGLSCSGGSCPNSASDNEFGVAVGKPFANPTLSDPTNVGQFQSLTYQTAVAGRNDQGSLFPVLTMDSAHTLYLLWTEGDGAASTSTAPASTDWHIYYSYSLDTAADGHTHATWSPPIQVDSGAATATSIMGWVAAGDPGKLGFIWLGTDAREHPSKANTSKQWHPFMAVTLNGNTSSPTFQQLEVGIGPNHIGDVCLQGTVGCITSIGNRNMADFISVDIGPNGALQGTWANDANQLATRSTTLIPGLPVTETAVETSGPQLIGTGTVSDSRFSATPTTFGSNDAVGDGRYPVQGGANVAQLDLTSSRIVWDGANVVVHIAASSLASLTSPDAVQNHVWWLTIWQFNHKIYFAKAESDLGGAVTCTAGAPKSFDRVGLNGQTVATLADYSGGTSEPCTQSGGEFAITVPAAVVGGPADGSVLEAVSGYTVLDDGLPPAVGPGPGSPPTAADNIPTITDATPAYNAVLTLSVVTPDAPLAILLPAAAALVLAGYGLRRRGRRTIEAA